MTTENQKLKRQEYLHLVIDHYMKTEPKLTEKEIAEIIVWQVGDITKLLRGIKKEIQKETKPKKLNYSEKVQKELLAYK